MSKIRLYDVLERNGIDRNHPKLNLMDSGAYIRESGYAFPMYFEHEDEAETYIAECKKVINGEYDYLLQQAKDKATSPTNTEREI